MADIKPYQRLVRLNQIWSVGLIKHKNLLKTDRNTLNIAKFRTKPNMPRLA
jgi:hypothetical protein